MKFTITPDKFQFILKKLSVDGLLPYAIISTKDGSFVSSQMERDSCMYRYVKFYKEYFEKIDDSEDTVRIDVEHIRRMILMFPPKTLVTMEYPSPTGEKNQMKITGNQITNHTPTIPVDKIDCERCRILPFEIKDGIPYIRSGKVALDTQFIMHLSDLKKISRIATILETKLFRFLIEDNTLIVRMEDTQSQYGYTDFKPHVKIVRGGLFDVCLYGCIKEIANTSTEDLNVNVKTNMPAWFSEKTAQYKFGALVASYRIDDNKAKKVKVKVNAPIVATEYKFGEAEVWDGPA